MPDPRRTPTPEPEGPVWARAVHLFCDPGFDVRSRQAFQEALTEFVRLPPAEREFHQTHMLFRVAQGLESIQGVLVRIHNQLDALQGLDLSALEHLEPMREALDDIAGVQQALLEGDGRDDLRYGEAEELADERDELDEDQDDGDQEHERPDEGDPDIIYDTIPDEQPDRPPRPRRRVYEPEVQPPQPARAEPPRSATRPPDPDLEVLVGELVPANEGPGANEAGAP